MADGSTRDAAASESDGGTPGKTGDLGPTATVLPEPPPAPRSSSPQPPRRRRSRSRPWEAVVGISTAASVIVALVLGLPNLLHRAPSAPHQPTAAAGGSNNPPTPIPSPPSIAVLSPAVSEPVTVTCVQATCAIDVRGRFSQPGRPLHPYVLIARECSCLDSTPVYYIQWDSTKLISTGDWVARAYVAKPEAGAAFQVRAILTTAAIRPSGSGEDLLIWSDSMRDKYGLVAESDVITVNVANVAKATAFCTCT